MRNMKTSMKLTVSFAIIIALAIIVGAVGYFGMASLSKSAQDLYNFNLIAVSAMGDLREQFNQERNDIRNIFLSLDDPDKVNSLIAGFADYEKRAAASFGRYEASIMPGTEGEETAYFSAKEAYLGPFAEMKKEMFAFIDAGKFDEAYTVFMEGSSVIGPITSGLAESTAQNDKWALEDSQKTITLHNNLTLILVIVLLAAVAVAVVLSVYISRIISKPLNLMAAALTQIGTKGDLEFSAETDRHIAEEEKRKDEFGTCIKAAVGLVDHLQNVGQTLVRVSEGDLAVEVALLSERDTMGLSLISMLDNLNAMFANINTSSDQVSSGSQQVAQEVNQNVETLIGESVRSMGEVLEAMQGIDESSRNITRVIKVIDDIAFQTNILALNAAVEAARAGQHGKGFAVVADEVRNLASKSAAAAKETAALIEGSSQKVSEGNRLVEQTNGRLEAVVANARKSVHLVNEVTAASDEQAKSIDEINQGMEQISTVVQSNSATAEQSAAASEQMSAQAVMLNEIVAKFKLRGSNSKAARAAIGTVGTSGGKISSGGFALSGMTGGSKY